MISLTLPTKRTPNSLTSIHQPSSKTNYKYLTVDVYNKRQKIITELYASCPYKVGDVVRPANDASFIKEGAFKITAICKDWKDYKGQEPDETKVEWKDDETVFMVDAVQIKGGKIWSTTVNYFIKLEKNDK